MSDEIGLPQAEKAKAAKGKRAAIGDDLDLADYESQVAEKPSNIDPSTLPSEDKERMLGAGVVLDELSQRSGTFIQVDNTPIHSSLKQDGIELMATSQAMAKYDWLKDYFWQAVTVDADKYTAHIELNQADGYFIRALPGSKSIYPIQACLYLAKSRLIQDVHNIVIAEEGSELHIITGCTTAAGREPGIHLGVSEFYIKKGAKVTFTMIHSWTPETGVRPRTTAIIDETSLLTASLPDG
jgi:Fe-S cluster assembly scaffold protein SufB